jgi:hypothetical protein
MRTCLAQQFFIFFTQLLLLAPITLHFVPGCNLPDTLVALPPSNNLGLHFVIHHRITTAEFLIRFGDTVATKINCAVGVRCIRICICSISII